MKKRIIVVDDDRTNLIVARNILIDDYDVYTVTSGKKLFEMIPQVNPNLILLDIKMPEMDGFETIKLLKNSDETKNIPVIFLTAMGNHENKSIGLEAGAVDIIFKPFLRESLLKGINEHLSSS